MPTRHERTHTVRQDCRNRVYCLRLHSCQAVFQGYDTRAWRGVQAFLQIQVPGTQLFPMWKRLLDRQDLENQGSVESVGVQRSTVAAIGLPVFLNQCPCMYCGCLSPHV